MKKGKYIIDHLNLFYREATIQKVAKKKNSSPMKGKNRVDQNSLDKLGYITKKLITQIKGCTDELDSVSNLNHIC